MLELAILGMLKEQELHGYELRKRLARVPGLTGPVSFGSLYPALGRLEGEGAVRALERPPAVPKMPMTGSLAGERAAFLARLAGPARGRGRRVYTITPRGEARFDELLQADAWRAEGPGAEEKGFLLRLAFGRHLPSEARLRLLERRKAHLQALLEEARRDRLPEEAKHDSTPVADDRWSRALAERSQLRLEVDLAWLERLLRAEQAGLAAHSGPGQQP